MNAYEHLSLPLFQGNVPRQTRRGGGGYKSVNGRNKNQFATENIRMATEITRSYNSIITRFSGRIDPKLIYEIEVNQGVNCANFEQSLTAMGIHVLSIAESKKGYWVVFCDDNELREFKRKLTNYGSEDGPNYDFFDAISSIRDIPREEKIGKALQDSPLGSTPDYVNIELWKMIDPRESDTFIDQLTQTYRENRNFRITDRLKTNSFVLLRVKLTNEIFEEIIDLKEIARVDRPTIPTFNQFEFQNIDLNDFSFNEPDADATGILVIDSGIISNHPMLENCIGDEGNFQSGESNTQDTVGHGTSIAGCAAYGDINEHFLRNNFQPSNWIFSAKVMYAERNPFNGEIIKATYDTEKLIENQLKEAVTHFLSNDDYKIRVVNISFGNSDEIWLTNYNRQLPLASLIDEFARQYSNVTFIVSTGNSNILKIFSSISEIVDNYPSYLSLSDKYFSKRPKYGKKLFSQKK